MGAALSIAGPLEPIRMNSADGVFERAFLLPDSEAQERYRRLIGLDEQKSRLVKMLSVLVHPAGLERWVQEHHPDALTASQDLLRRPPLVVLAGDVGSGKTELAETVGDAVARQEGIDITLFPLSLSTRGQGRVGEMTQLLSVAFDQTLQRAEKLKADGKARGGLILLVDEADALAQSREAAQMHHEDRAGVNAFIRGVDRLSSGSLPVAVIMCTNRLGALDPAVRRRCVDVLEFRRPTEDQRRAVLTPALEPFGIGSEEMDRLVDITGPSPERPYGFTFSDLTQRLIPSIILDAYPDRPVEGSTALDVATRIEPTPPFGESGDGGL